MKKSLVFVIALSTMLTLVAEPCREGERPREPVPLPLPSLTSLESARKGRKDK